MTNRIRFFTVCLILTLLCSVVLTSCGSDTQGVEAETVYENKITYSVKRESGSADFIVFRVGEADAMLMVTETQTVLIDCGERDDFDADKILAYLESQGIEKLDCVIVSNYRYDNIGGYEKLAESIAIDHAVVPTYNISGHRYTNFLRDVLRHGTELHEVSTQTELTFDDLTVTVYPAVQPTAYLNEKDMSLVLLVTHGENRLLLTSDIGDDRIAEVMEQIPDPVKLVQMPYHGAYTEALDAFLTQYAPRHAVITDSKTVPVTYDTISLLVSKNVSYYRTANATVCIRSNGKKLTVEQN